MAVLEWDKTGERFYETGVDKGVLYIQNSSGEYKDGVAWNGLTSVNESPSGAEASPQYADNIKYLTLTSAEEFALTIEAYTYPDKFAECDGTSELESGVFLGQQPRKTFGFCYRTKVGNDVQNDELGYKIHLIYGCKAAPSERSNSTINDSPEAITFSWEISTTPVSVSGKKPTAHIIIDSRKIESSKLKSIEDTLYGTSSKEPELPLPDKIIEMIKTPASLPGIGG